MPRRDVSICSLVLILSLCIIPSLHAKEQISITGNGGCGWQRSCPREKRDPISSLYLHLMTRPGVTAESDVKHLIQPAHEAAFSFRRTLFQGKSGMAKQARFTKEVRVLDDAYRAEYASAPEGIAGAEARGAALDRLLDGLLVTAVRIGIPLEDLDLALLHGCVAIEKRILQRPLSTRLTETDRELIEYLLRFMVHQERRRILLDSTKEALRNVRASEEIRSLYDDRIYRVFKPALSREPVGLETFLADPTNFDELRKILMAEYNLEATCDLFGMKYAMELYYINFDGQVSPLLDSLISSIADRIPGMTPELLREQLATVHGLWLPSLAAYSSIPPALPISYSPLSGLADRLAALGETPPAPPDFALFNGPYRALFMLNYDILLSDLITAKEWYLADINNPDPTRPLSLSDQYAVKASAMMRSALLRSRIRGVPEQTVRSMMILMRSSLRDRI